MEVEEFIGGVREALEAITTLPEEVRRGVVDRVKEDDRERSLFACLGFDSEAFAVRQMLHFLKHPTDAFPPLKALPVSPDDTIRQEYSLRVGRADIVVFHVDGSVSVIEVKDGATGYRAVVAGIGQATMYACQIGLVPGSVSAVRRALAWSSMGKSEEDDLMEKSCKAAGVIPIQLFSKNQLQDLFQKILSSRCDDRLDFLAKEAGFDDFTKLVADMNESVQALLDLIREKV